MSPGPSGRSAPRPSHGLGPQCRFGRSHLSPVLGSPIHIDVRLQNPAAQQPISTIGLGRRERQFDLASMHAKKLAGK
jgi:hypothetical protein